MKKIKNKNPLRIRLHGGGNLVVCTSKHRNSYLATDNDRGSLDGFGGH